MARINTSKVIIGGLAAGVVMNIIDATANGYVLASRWAAQTEALHPGLMASVGNKAMIGWIIVDFITGIFIVWLYAAIRPRYGAGVMTALRAGFKVWLITHVWTWAFVFEGMFSDKLMGASAAAGLVAALAGAYVGGMLYKEDDAV